MLITSDDVDAAVRLQFEELRLEWTQARAAQVRRHDPVAAARVEVCLARLDALLDTWNSGQVSRALSRR